MSRRISLSSQLQRRTYVYIINAKARSWASRNDTSVEYINNRGE